MVTLFHMQNITVGNLKLGYQTSENDLETIFFINMKKLCCMDENLLQRFLSFSVSI